MVEIISFIIDESKKHTTHVINHLCKEVDTTKSENISNIYIYIIYLNHTIKSTKIHII